jgi:SAM-dependent methyltransferase
MLAKLLAHPLTRNLDIDSPDTTHLRTRIIQQKTFLRKIYKEWYKALAAAIPDGEGDVLELGSGGGFLSRFIPGLITSEVFPVPGVSRVVDAHDLPFPDRALKAIVMTNVFHHLSRPRQFLTEAARCIRHGGTVAMIEPWNSPWSRWVYRRFHHEPFEPAAQQWEFPPSGPLSGANGALPWIVFERDRLEFSSTFPQWRLQTVRPCMPFRYLLSGGVSLRSIVPGFSFSFWRWFEKRLTPWMASLAMFAQVILCRTEVA